MFIKPRHAMGIVFGSVLMFGAHTTFASHIFIHGKQAKHLYNSLTGSKVKDEGTAGHTYRKGKCVLCRYTSADITQKGKAVPAEDSSRYTCSMTFNHNGHASPGPNP